MRRFLSVRVAAAGLTAISAVAGIGCGDAFDPASVTATYALRQVDGDLLPALLFTTDFVRVRVLADTLQLRADDTGTQISIWEIEPLQPGLAFDNPTRVKTDLRLTMRSDRIEANIVCPPYALCTRPPHWVARLLTNGLRVDFAAGQRAPLLYSRIPADE